ncbi:hypothetical protein [Dyadobacter aurulentus]|uniref:hypothetical protein n=1 Tax=Dyadobacter sp. UC 10 TaxID=2605428 RepID=UPI001788BD24|nr:hypothetical protein [Dyadobacter sp. UC 10]
MKVSKKNIGTDLKITYDRNLDNLPIPKIVADKTERARKFLEEHPAPEHILKR